MMVPALKDQNARLVIVLLSEFDVFRDQRMPTERMRYFGEWPEKVELIGLMPSSLIWANRSELVDLMFADVTPLWRDRDLYRVLALSTWWKAPAKQSEVKDEKQRYNAILDHGNALKTSISRTRLLELNFGAFEKFAESLRDQGIELWVFEGMTNPLATAVYDPNSELRTEARERFTAMAEKSGFQYVSAASIPTFTETDFADALHLNTSAIQRFTDFISKRLCESICPKTPSAY
jgi:hypothetical protein